MRPLLPIELFLRYQYLSLPVNMPCFIDFEYHRILTVRKVDNLELQQPDDPVD